MVWLQKESIRQDSYRMVQKYLPLKNDVTVKPAITSITVNPNLGSHKPPIAINIVAIHPYFLTGLKILLAVM